MQHVNYLASTCSLQKVDIYLVSLEVSKVVEYSHNVWIRMKILAILPERERKGEREKGGSVIVNVCICYNTMQLYATNIYVLVYFVCENLM